MLGKGHAILDVAGGPGEPSLTIAETENHRRIGETGFCGYTWSYIESSYEILFERNPAY